MMHQIRGAKSVSHIAKVHKATKIDFIAQRSIEGQENILLEDLQCSKSNQES